MAANIRDDRRRSCDVEVSGFPLGKIIQRFAQGRGYDPIVFHDDCALGARQLETTRVTGIDGGRRFQSADGSIAELERRNCCVFHFNFVKRRREGGTTSRERMRVSAFLTGLRQSSL